MGKRPESSRFRRVFEQTIMWIVLAGTTGAAAWVSARSNRLDQPRSFGGVMLRLPHGWVETSESMRRGTSFIEGGDEWFARTITLRHETPTFSIDALLGGMSRVVLKTEQVPLRDGSTATVNVIRRPIEIEGYRVYELEMLAILEPPGRKRVLVSLEQTSAGSKRDVETNLKLMKQILGTVKFSEPGER
jgi:hypothetical protein